ncbi:MAG: HEPN domain-containing protein [Bacteroidetes bacterium]|nr:HEPN domain-containing protein [Bacteroidota bacterium]
MIDIQKQIEYWRDQAVSDMETAEILIEKKKFLHGLFFCHLVIEKILKAHYVKVNQKIPPKTHDLIYLLKHSEIKIENNELIFLGILMKYQLACPDSSVTA